MGESRTELLAWLNNLLKTNYTKIEQCGTGAAHCQIIDSIYHDVQMSKVKFDAKHQYEYVQNFKVLQGAFAAHKIDKVVPVERLILCKFQDNLEFLQWMKKYWDSMFHGGQYDAEARRKGKVGGGHVPSAGPPSKKPVSLTNGTGKPYRHHPDHEAQATKSAAGVAVSHGAGDMPNVIVDDLERQINDLRIAVVGLEKERDFYFGKLRDIEVLTQHELDATSSRRDKAEVVGVGTVLKEIQAVLYSTEEGFEVPAEANSREARLVAEEDTF